LAKSRLRASADAAVSYLHTQQKKLSSLIASV
jgi:hypothetical protein